MIVEAHFLSQVIIDNMMNLEVRHLASHRYTHSGSPQVLFAAADLNGNQTLRDIAVRHADTTIINHFRPDGNRPLPTPPARCSRDLLRFDLSCRRVQFHNRLGN